MIGAWGKKTPTK